MKELMSLSWDAHQKNICSGLSLLQQRGEFVDMTLAADGHHVQVHQVVVSMASPYIKALISSAKCPHPVIFLNNISHSTLCSILEYIYTGEVNVRKDELKNLMAAGKALHIKGLIDMSDPMDYTIGNFREASTIKENNRDANENKKGGANERPKEKMCEVFLESSGENYDDDVTIMTESENVSKTGIQGTKKINTSTISSKNNKNKEHCDSADIQYTVSNQGNLQLIVNRYIYNLKYVQKNMNKYWRCVDYAAKKCPANIYTNDDRVLRRRCAHNHPFHDVRIMQKLRKEIIFKAFNEAKDRAEQKKATDNVELVKQLQSGEDSE